MKCPNCGEEMLVEYEYERGRHVRRKYKCPKCDLGLIKRTKTIYPRGW